MKKITVIYCRSEFLSSLSEDPRIGFLVRSSFSPILPQDQVPDDDSELTRVCFLTIEACRLIIKSITGNSFGEKQTLVGKISIVKKRNQDRFKIHLLGRFDGQQFSNLSEPVFFLARSEIQNLRILCDNIDLISEYLDSFGEEKTLVCDLDQVNRSFIESIEREIEVRS